jgi:glucose-6-phosphate 1-dehydrogenase
MNPSCFSDCLFILFGATGDLAKRKLIPALYKLIEDKKLCHFAIIGTALEAMEKNKVLEQSKPFIQNFKPEVWDQLIQAFYYYPMDFYHGTMYANLKPLVEEVERTHKLSGNRILYFATMPHHFPTITKFLLESNLVNNKHATSPWTRLVYEKPFGQDTVSSQGLNNFLRQAFAEEQIFRIDHYLGKELVGNIALARFTNRIFEPLWHKDHIESVHISIKETLGVEQRGAYYDEYGQLKDMVQSHMLQLLALTAMESPGELTANNIRNAKAAVLEKVVIDKVLLGQYTGYQAEPGVSPTSQTDTFTAIRLFIENKRWQGVPFYLITGKKLDTKETTIELRFKMAKCPLTSCPSQPNALIFKIHPDDGIYLRLNAKIPGIALEVAPVSMDFCHSCLFGPNTPEAYETLLADVIRGDQAAFIRADEVEASWQIVDKIVALKKDLHAYERGSQGPAALTSIYLPRKEDE